LNELHGTSSDELITRRTLGAINIRETQIVEETTQHVIDEESDALAQSNMHTHAPHKP
jgi:hypothetical protein